MSCKKINIVSRKVCIGDLSKKVTIYNRTIDTPDNFQDYDYGQNLTQYKIAWAAIQTTTGKELFDGVNLVGVITHYIYIKYDANVTAQNIIQYNGNYFRVLRTENLDEDSEFLLLYCALRGSTSKEVNQQ